MPSSPSTKINAASLQTLPVTRLKGVGPQMAEKLARLNIQTCQDLLFHLPSRYEDRTRITLSSQAQQGVPLVMEGDLVSCDIAFGRRRSLLCRLRDAGGLFSLRFYYFSGKQQQLLAHAKRVRCFGELRRGAAGLEMYHPEYTILKGNEPLEQQLTPIYPLTEGVTQARLRLLVNQLLDQVENEQLLFEDLLGDDYPSGGEAFTQLLISLHRPSNTTDIQALLQGQHPAQQRLAFEELLAHHVGQLKTREAVRKRSAQPLRCIKVQQSDFIRRLGFSLTHAQENVIREIEADLCQASPMQRLLQGDVGSGKTVVAAMAAVNAMACNVQTAIMAPTEILAEQHYLKFTEWFGAFDTQLGWLSSKVKGKKREEQLALIANGDARIIIGTHALIQPDVVFRHLGLVIVDEQHRFGVNQRLTLLEKGSQEGHLPHQLFMTATPIPRTLAMSLYADMDTSVIDALPPGRKAITTLVLSDTRRQEVIERLHAACRAGAQAYWVCTLIDESDNLDFKAAEAAASQLREELRDIRVALIHGRMAAREKSALMSAFKKGEIQLLVSTTVIEVGVDVPNASLMVIENAERLGLAQLHQLRGRVGRGSKESHCVLMYHSPVSQRVRDRLQVMRASTDGFYIAEEDLRMRGPGEILGQRQSGDLSFRIADLSRDAHLLGDISRVGKKLLATDRPRLDKLLNRWLPYQMQNSQV